MGAYFNAVTTDNPSNWWRLADPGGIIAQDIGSATPRLPLYVATPGSAPYLGPSSDGAATARAGNNASLYNLMNGIPLLNLWTFETWFWPFSATTQQNLMTLENDPGGLRASIREEASGHVIGYVAGQASADWAGPIKAQEWHHYALTYDHITLRLYVDGVQKATSAFVVSTAAQVSPRVGEDQGAAGLATGFFADAAYYNGTLTAAQLLAHYNAADQVASTPLYLGGGTYDVTLGSSGGLSGDLAAILNSVRKVY